MGRAAASRTTAKATKPAPKKPVKKPAKKPATKPPAAPSAVLLRRATFGPGPDLTAQAKGLTSAQWLDRQLAPEGVPDPVVDVLFPRFPELAIGTADYIARAKAEDRFGNWDQMGAFNQLTLARQIWGRRQLLERMVDFWSNHFNVTCPSDAVWATRADYGETVLRRHALGSVRDLLRGVVHHPAMIMYLNQDTSSREHPNENLGRELLELHTVGVEAGYTETDVLNAARVLTGLGRDWDTQAYVYRPSWHWTGAVKVLDFTDPNTSADGQGLVVRLLDHLARHKATARRIATKLCRHFVSDTPPAALVNRMAAAYLANDTAIAPVLRVMFLSAEFAASTGTKVRRPAEQLVAVARTLGVRPAADPAASVEGVRALYWAIGDMANQPNAWPTPDGYPTAAEEWRSAGSTLVRTNWAMALAQGWNGKLVTPPVTGLVPTPRPAHHGGLVAGLYQRLHGRAMASADVLAVCAFLDVPWSQPLTASSPVLDPRWQLPQLVGLLLNAPAVALS